MTRRLAEWLEEIEEEGGDSTGVCAADDDLELAEEDAPEDRADEAAAPGEIDVVTLYFREASRHTLLAPERERALLKTVQRGRQARRRLNNSRSIKPVLRQDLMDRIAQADVARDELVRTNARLVISIAKRYQNFGLPLLDLIQEGNLGLLRAIDRFDLTRGLRLSTYATWWIRQAVSRGVANQGRTVRLPAFQQERLGKLRRVTQELEDGLGRAPNDEELAMTLGVSLETLADLRAFAAPLISLDEPPRADGGESIVAHLADSAVVPMDELVARRLQSEALDRALTDLPARSAQILRLRFGLDGNKPRTLGDIGKNFKLSRERVRQIEREAIFRLREHAGLRRERSHADIDG